MRNRRQRRSTAWRIGLLGSCAVHIILVAVLFSFGRRSAPGPTAAVDSSALAIYVQPLETALDPASEGPAPPSPAVELAPVPRPWDARPGDRDNPVAATVAPADADGRLRLAPAPDQGLAGGHPLEHAYRRDRSTLHARLTDAAESLQAHLRTSRHPAASAQAIRHEPVVGIGDAVRTRTPARAPGQATPRSERAVALGGEPGGAAPDETHSAPTEPPQSVPRVAERPAAEHAVGPLDADQGARSFDVERVGPASDDQTMRAASDERHPGLTDFSRAAAPAPAAAPDGRGPGAAPGAVARPANGAAPATLGAPDPKVFGPAVTERTLDRRYERYKLEIRQRVNRVLEFPKALALRLEQGETIVEFVVDVDGRLGDGPRVVKSSGFEEFDSAAVRAVRRAAPFPPMSDRASARPQQVSMPVKFDNPVIR
jgi:protein TonB